jgi:tRNA1Val (adenine37-N6)-methyltransferase
MGTVFRFKEFEVDQQGCAMKINTDGVLLGASVQINNPQSILDIGTGTGVIALMLAQRFRNAKVDAVEIDAEAYQTSLENFKNSSFTLRIRGNFGSFENLVVSTKYDLIISNPPFYTNSLHNPDARKTLARHADFDFFDKLLIFTHTNLSENGQLTLILPIVIAEYVVNNGERLGLYLNRSIDVKSFSDSEVIRNIISLGKQQVKVIQTEEFVIYQEKGVYSEEYRTILKPFFLAF